MAGPGRILVCGGREFADYQKIIDTMDHYSQWFAPGFCIIHGGAPGADRLAGRWAAENGVPAIIFPAHWEFYGGKAGSLRNIWMVVYGMPDLVIAFPGGIGTGHMISYARRKQIPVQLVE